MLAGQFDFARSAMPPKGYRDAWGTYYVEDGNHRLAAALEIERETGDPWAVHEILQHGDWNDRLPPPASHGPFPHRGWRGWWAAVVNWLENRR